MRRSSPHPLGCDKSAAQTMQPQALAPQALVWQPQALVGQPQALAPQALVGQPPGNGNTT